MDLPTVYSRAQRRAAGYSDPDVRWLLRSGGLTRVRRGTYLRGAWPEEGDLRHAVAARAAMESLADGAVASHVTAAVLHGLPVWRIPLDRVHVTRARRSGSRTGTRIRVHTAPLEPAEIVELAGMPVTSLGRTVVDLARTVPFELAVAVADAALRGDEEVLRRRTSGERRGAGPPGRGAGSSGRWAGVAGAASVRSGTGSAGDGRSVGADAGPTWRSGVQATPRRGPLAPEALVAALARAVRWPGAPAARQVIAFADGRSASVGESRSRVAIARAGLPTPVLQWEVVDRDGGFIGLTDFGWPELDTVGEFDGRIKYGRLLRLGEEPGDVVFAEKLREDRLRDQDLAVVRWTWPDLAHFAPVADRLRRRFRRSA